MLKGPWQQCSVGFEEFGSVRTRVCPKEFVESRNMETEKRTFCDRRSSELQWGFIKLDVVALSPMPIDPVRCKSALLV